MKLSTRSTYGVRAMLALALHQGEGQLMVKEIAEQQSLPPTYLEQLMSTLRKAGLVAATRGAKGGYVLARPAREITLAEVIETLEGPLELAECPNGVGCCGHPESCALNEIWQLASDTLRGVFSDITLANLAERQRTRETSKVLMFDI